MVVELLKNGRVVRTINADTPKKLSKAGEFRRKHGALIKVLDRKAVEK